MVLTANSPSTGDQAWDREYVYGPDYVDEFVAEVAPGATGDAVMYVTQDANANVVGLYDDQGALATQYTYTPYGRLAAAEDFNAPFDNRIGHQGLFYDRFEFSTTATPPGDPVNGPMLVPDLTYQQQVSQAEQRDPAGLYYNRNRYYSPELGRFTQNDPNGTGLPALSVLGAPGLPLGVWVDTFRLLSLYGDGLSLYAYLGGNPIHRRDPSGLGYSAMEDAIDEAIGEIIADHAAVVGTLNAVADTGVNVAKFIGQQAVSFLPGADVVQLGAKLFNGEDVTLGDFLFAGLDLAGIGIFADIAAKTVKAFRRADKASDSLNLARRACNCFVAGTLVDTPGGSVPIEQLDVGDVVYTRHESDPPDCAASSTVQQAECPDDIITADSVQRRVGRVTRIFRNLAPAILWLTLADGTVLGTTPGHEVWTHEDGWTFAGQLELGDTFTDHAGRPVALAAIEIDSTPTTVDQKHHGLRKQASVA